MAFFKMEELYQRLLKHAEEQEDDIAVHFNKSGETKQEDEQHPFQIGICPESAYERMIADCITHKDDNAFWQKHYISIERPMHLG